MHNHAAPAVAAKALPTSQLPKVRLATVADLDEVIALGKELHRENGLMEIDEETIVNAARAAVLGKDGMFGVIGKPGHIEALIYLQLRQYWYSKQMHLEEMFLFCKEEYRRSNHAKALIEFAKTAALKLDVPLLIGVLSNHRTEAKVRLYQRRLGKPAGAFFLFNGKTGHTEV